MSRRLSFIARISPAFLGLLMCCPDSVSAQPTISETGGQEAAAAEDHWFLPGLPLHAEPSSEASVIHRLDSVAILPVLDQRGAWTKVRYLGEEGWADSRWAPPWDRDQAYRGVQRNIAERAFSSNQKRLKIAKRILGLREPTRSSKDRQIYTDVDDPRLLDRIERLGAMAQEIFFARYGRLPSGKPKEAVVIFQNRQDYETYVGKLRRGQLSGTGGHAGSGLAVMWRGEKHDSSLLNTLLHEMGHLLAMRSLALRLPPWIGEGLASHVGVVWIEEEGTRRSRSSFRFIDGKIAVMGRQMKKGTMPGIGALATLDQETFSEHASTAYTHAAVFIYFLQQDPGYSVGFAAFLDDIAAGYRGTMGLLLKHLDTDVESLDQELRWWIKHQNELLDARYREGPRRGSPKS